MAHSRPVPVDLDERLLDKVLGPSDVAGEKVADSHESRPLVGHELGERRLVSVHVAILTLAGTRHPEERDFGPKG